MKYALPYLMSALCLLVVLPAQAQELSRNTGSGGADAIAEWPESLAPTSITHSTDMATITMFNSISCNASGVHVDNSYVRWFDLDGDVDGVHSLSSFTPMSVDWAVETATSATGGGQPATVNLYVIPELAASPGGGSLILPAVPTVSTPITVPDGAMFAINTPTVGAPVIDGNTSDLLVEIFTPDATASGASLFIGSNPNGQTSPGFLAAAGCGIINPADIGAIGFPGMHIIMRVNGDGTLLPVELVDFSGLVEADAVTLSWQTASETDNSGFEIQHQRGGTFHTLDFVEGYGSTLEAQHYSYRVTNLEPGTHTFRLKQIDFDGQFEFSPEVEATVEVVDHYFLAEAYPNPFNPSSTIRFAVDASQPVVLALYNVHGQRVRTLYTGTPPADEMQTVQIDGSNLPSGTYMIQLIGNTFRAGQSVTLLK